MPRIIWNTIGEHYYETGVDRGVLYVDGADGVPWNGLISVVEAPTGGDPKSYYFDGVNYLNLASSEEFEATLSAYYSPPEFDECDGVFSLSQGLVASQQPRRQFGLSYRTMLGDDLNNINAYKIHIVYNALAFPTTKRYATIDSNIDPLTLDWRLRTKPVQIQSLSPSAHLTIDTSKALSETVGLLEDILYGTESTPARLPAPQEILTLFEAGLLTWTETRFSNPDRTVAEGDWGTAVFTDDARTVLVDRPDWLRTFEQHDVPLIDTFSRVRSSSGWGVADSGGKWNHSGGTNPDDYSVDSGIATLALTTGLVTRHSYIGSYDLTDQIVSSKFSIDERASANGGAAFGVALARVDSSNHYRCKIDIDNPNLYDDFTRTSTSGWGTMTSGNSWTINGGTSVDYTIDGSVGKLIMSAKNSSRRVFSGDAENGEVLVKVAPSAVATGGSFTIGVLLRHQGSLTQYMARLEFTTAATATLKMQKNDDGDVTDLTTDINLASPSYAANTWFWIHAKIEDSQLSASAWKDGTTEPSSWMTSIEDISLTGTGAFGLRAYAFSANTNPNTVNILVDEFTTTINDGSDVMTAVIQKDEAGSFTDLAEVVVGTIQPDEVWNIEGRRFDLSLEMRVWLEGTYRPGEATVETTDPTFTSGRSGVFGFIKAAESPRVLSVSDFFVSGTVVNPATIDIMGRVYALDEPFDGAIDRFQLLEMIKGENEDLLQIAMQFINGAVDIYNGQGYKIRGDAHYGPRDTDGSLIEGSDFNDYMGITWTYVDSGDDPNEPAQIGCLDCSGYVRMCFGPVGLGMPVRVSGNDGNAIPRVSYQQMDPTSPGVTIIPNTGVVPTDFTALQVGDVVGFDADSDEGTSSQIDHVGIYLGVDANDDYIFVSSRKSIDGPTFSVSGGASKLNGSGLYATTFRVAKRF